MLYYYNKFMNLEQLAVMKLQSACNLEDALTVFILIFFLYLDKLRKLAVENFMFS
jgi:hypothetical protein